MTNQTLEQEAEISEGSNVLIERCGYCRKELKIPKKAAKKLRWNDKQMFTDERRKDPLLDKQYNGVYISLEGFPYCNRDCNYKFSED